MKLVARPITLKAANAFVAQHHRHNKPVRGARYSIAAYEGETLIGVAIVGRPIARHMDDGMTVEVLRTCVRADVPVPRNVNSFLYSKARNVWQVWGGKRVITYTLTDESGASLRGAGWKHVADTAASTRGWASAGRPREYQEIYGKTKRRWEVICG